MPNKNSPTRISMLLQQPQFIKNGKLDLYNRQITDNDIPELCKFLAKHPEIQELNLYGNEISDEGAKMLANIKLTHLDIGLNCIKFDGAKALAANPFFTHLNICNTIIGEQGANILVATSKTLVYLDIRNCSISYDNKDDIKEFLKNKTLISLKLDGNKINTDLEKQIKIHIQNNRARKKHFSRLYGQVIRGYDKDNTNKDDANPHYRGRFLAEQIFSVAISPLFFQNQQVAATAKKIMQEFSGKPKSLTRI